VGERRRRQSFEGNDNQRNRETRPGGGERTEEWTSMGQPRGAGNPAGRQSGGEIGDRGYEREFYGANEGRGSGAGSRRYPEIRQGYMGGEHAGGEYGTPREERDYRGAPRFESELSARDESGFQQAHYAGRREAPESGSWGGRYGSSEPYGRERSSFGQPGSWSPASPERGSAWSGTANEPEVRFGMHAPWELRPREARHEEPRYGGGWPEGGFRDESRLGKSGGRASQYGRGPKGYVRSDDRLNEEINERLMRDPDIDASEVEVRVENCVVTLGGSVADRNEKYRVEDLVARVMGVKDVTNQLRIVEDRSNGASSSDGDKSETVKYR